MDCIISGVYGPVLGYNMFAYCFNNPVNTCDPSGHFLQWIKDTYNTAKETITDLIEEVGDWAYSVYYNATKWHFEDRIAANGEHPTYDEVSDNPDWRKLSKDESIFHQDGIGNDDLKFIHGDGREAVFNGDTLEPMTDPRYMGTYNYYVLYEMPNNPNVHDYANYIYTYTMHTIVDVVPYVLTGCSNTREQFEAKVISLFD